MDTITLSSAKPYLEVALLPQISLASGQKINISSASFLLLQSNDTVTITYQKSGYYSYKSKQYASQVHNENVELLSKLYSQSQDLYYSLLYAYSIQKQTTTLSPNFVSPDSLQNSYLQKMTLESKHIDSLGQSGILSPNYCAYYQYRLKQLSAVPILAKRFAKVNTPTIEAIRPLLNDSLCTYPSYWSFLVDLKEPLVMVSFTRLPQACDATSTKIETDQRQIFDVLCNYTDSIPPRTLNLLRYLCLDQMRGSGAELFPQADQDSYLKKYQAISNDFLEQTPNTAKTGIDKLVGTPFRFFLYLIEFAAYTFIVLVVYRRWLRKRMGLVTRRVYLLLGLLACMLVPLFTMASQLRAIEKTAYWNTIVSPIAEVLFCLYLLGCCVLLYEMARWLWQVEKMRRNSWRIPDKRYTLCVLTDIECKPSIFGRKIFISWSDWQNPTDKLAKEQIIDSERYRVEHWHTFDSLLLAAVRIGCWGNPLLYAYHKELQKANDMAASNHAYCNRTTMLYTATEEARELHSDLILGLAGSESTQKNNQLFRWFSNVKYQLLILLVVFMIVAVLIELVGTISKLSETSFF